MSFQSNTLKDFVDVLASNAAVPGGGGASALVGALGVALGNMVGSLTVGKKKYADVEAEIIDMKEQSDALQNEFLALIDGDAEVFAPLSKAYSIPKDDPARAEIMEAALRLACTVPMDIIRACAKSIDLLDEFAAKGSTLAISDAAVGAEFARAAINGAFFNVLINTKAMTDREYADNLQAEADALVQEYSLRAEEIAASVYQKLRR
jgi:formiminotetrahydrofolate cyclodeaminase